ncbi:intermembrane phospholipid transport protein YdbH family protein [Colwellia sp. TT2012]|uniref:intermembrane phospholipid transport protein YdbH family protein n=1 Tax=Colwellia sp. TT2012 TaxID=1720342 RepID=UPI001E65B597|nr:YdbH domain-containing protein [Colwellia sp. TT2012]
MVFATVWYSRSSVVTSIVNNYLVQHNSAITCIEFTLNTDFDLLINRLCIDTPYADLELINTRIKWQFEPAYLTAAKIAESISAIHIASANVRAKADISLPVSSTPQKYNEFPIQLSQLLNDIVQFTVPVELDIQAFSYQVFTNQQNQQTQQKLIYQGGLSATAEQFHFSLANAKQEYVFALDLVRKQQGFSANINTDLARLRSFLTVHQSALPPALVAQLVNAENEAWSVMGQFNSQIDWHQQVLTMTNTLSHFSFRAEQGFAQSGPIEIEATLAWQSVFTVGNLTLDFTHDKNQASYQHNKIQLIIEQPQLLKALSAQGIAPQVINFLNDNVINEVSVSPRGLVKIDFAKQRIISDGFNISTSNINEPLILSLNNLALSYHDKAAITVNLQKAQFLLTGQVNIGQLQPFSKQLVRLNIIGELVQYNDFWQVTLGEDTAIEITQLSLPVTLGQQEKIKNKPTVTSFISHWQGSVAIAKKDLKSQKNNIAGVTFELEINNQISQLHLPNIIHINRLELNTKVSGSVDKIVIHAEVIADNLAIARVKLTGDIRQPSIEIFAKELLITDLFALKIKLPIEMELIDGTLSYHLSGQIKNNENFMANPMLLALSVKDVSGEIDGTWLQELNWQQQFILQHDRLTSIAAEVKGKVNAVNNLTIAKIETATVITQFSTQTAIDFVQGELNVVARNTQGNLFGGSFAIAHAQWPFSKTLAVEVKLTKIDLEKLLELDKKQGIVVTGKVSGQLPLYYDGEHFLIKAGHLHNVGDGLIQVYNNSAVAELKASSTEFSLAFAALENLHYHHLTSAVSMTDDGYMLLVTEIKGRNPDLDNEVNLNLNLSYDLLGLLESFNITEYFENKLIKGLH